MPQRAAISPRFEARRLTWQLLSLVAANAHRSLVRRVSRNERIVTGVGAYGALAVAAADPADADAPLPSSRGISAERPICGASEGDRMRARANMTVPSKAPVGDAAAVVASLSFARAAAALSNWRSCCKKGTSANSRTASMPWRNF